jgi:hypothetical protein
MLAAVLKEGKKMMVIDTAYIDADRARGVASS